MIVEGRTRIGLILGHPVTQVKSPGLFNRHFEAQGEDAALVPLDVLPEQLATTLAALRGWANVRGCIVTVPHKRAVVPHLDALSARAKRLDAVNVFRREPDGRLVGDNVDGIGFTTAASAHGFRAQGRAALVVGAGGVGSAIADALCEAGIARLVLHDAAADHAAWLAGMLVAAFPAVAVTAGAAPLDLGEFDLVVNATPVGMGGGDALPLPAATLATLRPDALVADVVTDPSATPLLRAAAARGCRVQAGPEMTAGQMQALGRAMGMMG